MKHFFSDRRGRSILGSLLLGAATALATAPALAADPVITGPGDGTVAPVATHALPNVPGKQLTAVLVTYPPGGKSGSHHHAGSVFAYVVSGAIRSQVSDQGPARIYKAGESFFEPPGSEHLVSANASATEPASLLAIFIADDGAELTVFDK